ncbi:hypothetical protein FZEAL_6318 [Fusarium zealandicum]|uniref:Uncharacterized protein n=1 Tax=Fusarium zealandicum TaxID=1053134 RepID=A0A8H4XK09_9HYPO|nr:hypothetical protein FZEAL_6318 [Fusarium zealandicum]
MLFIPPSTAPGLGLARGSASRLSHRRGQGRQPLPSAPQSRHTLGNEFRYRRMASVPRGAEQVSEDGVERDDQVSRSRGHHQPSNPRPFKRESTTRIHDPEHDLDSDLKSRKRARVSSPSVVRGGWRADDQRSSNIGDGNLLWPSIAHAGSWCHLAPMASIEIQPALVDKEDILAPDWHPATPREARLPTPDLAPMCTRDEFCWCCPKDGKEEEWDNEECYIVSRAKMDSQMIDALGYIALNRSAPGVTMPGQH